MLFVWYAVKVRLGLIFKINLTFNWCKNKPFWVFNTGIVRDLDFRLRAILQQ